MSADHMPCGCYYHYDHFKECNYLALAEAYLKLAKLCPQLPEQEAAEVAKRVKELKTLVREWKDF